MERKRMSTHRHIQLYKLIDSLESMSRVKMRAGVNALRIGNFKAADHFFAESSRAAIVCEKARRIAEGTRPVRIDPENKKPRPICSKNCKWKINASMKKQQNALRVETMVDPSRCGWNIKPGMIGGHPLDYAPCAF